MKAVKKILTFLADMSGKGGGEQEGKNYWTFGEYMRIYSQLRRIKEWRNDFSQQIYSQITKNNVTLKAS